MNSVGGTSPGPGDASGPGLGAHDLARGQVEGGLVVQEQLALVQGPAQVGLQLDPGHQLGVHLRVVAGKAALAGRLGPVHGQVGVAQLVGAVDVAVHAGDAHAAAPHVQLAAVDHERLAEALQDPLGHLGHVDVVAGVLDEHGELVPAEAGHGVAGPHAGVEPLGHLDGRRSPAAWPRLSLTSLKPSRSRNSTATEGVCRLVRWRAWSTRSLNRARLAREVSESWKAWWTSWSSRRRRSEMSRVLSTSPPTLGLSSRLVTVNWTVHWCPPGGAAAAPARARRRAARPPRSGPRAASPRRRGRGSG
jgi:hypothetical protein